MNVLFEPLLYELATLGQAKWCLLYQCLCTCCPGPLCFCELADLRLRYRHWQLTTPFNVGLTYRDNGLASHN